jgi:hypothetical protein
MIKTLFEKAPQEKGPFQYLVAVWDSSKRGFLATVRPCQKVATWKTYQNL